MLMINPISNPLINLGVLCVLAVNRFSLLSLRLCGSSTFAFAFCTFGGSLPHIRHDGTDHCDAAAIRELSAAIAPFQRH